MKGGWIYIVTNKYLGILYIGVTSDLLARIFQHRNSLIDGFTKRYHLTKLVWYEYYDDIQSAIQREKTMKHWIREWKINVINEMNPEWKDLYETLA
jgi:putative endonuclease